MNSFFHIIIVLQKSSSLVGLFQHVVLTTKDFASLVFSLVIVLLLLIEFLLCFLAVIYCQFYHPNSFSVRPTDTFTRFLFESDNSALIVSELKPSTYIPQIAFMSSVNAACVACPLIRPPHMGIKLLVVFLVCYNGIGS